MSIPKNFAEVGLGSGLVTGLRPSSTNTSRTPGSRVS